MPSKKCGIPRDWSKSEQLSVSEKISLKSAGTLGSASGISGITSARFINSVSDLYATDEIDALLEEIRDLEPGSVHTDDVQDFEIDGSISRLPFVGNGGSMTCDSRTSVHSWDSHALYRHNEMEEGERTIVGGPVSVYCDCQHVKTPIGILRLVLIVTSLLGLVCLLSSGSEDYGVFTLPFVARIRLMLFIILFTTLVTLLLLFLDISLLYHAFPFHYHRWAIAIYTMECAAFMGSSALIVTLVQIYQESFPWIHPVTRNTLIAASVFGFLAGSEALGLAIYGFYELCRLHLPKREDTDQMTLTERAQQNEEGSSSLSRSQGRTRRGSGSKHRHISGPICDDEPPVTSTVWPIDDREIKPCSSKHIQPSGSSGPNHHH